MKSISICVDQMDMVTLLPIPTMLRADLLSMSPERTEHPLSRNILMIIREPEPQRP